MPTPEQWEDKFMDKFCVMLDRAERENGETSAYWYEQTTKFIKSLISQQRKEAYNDAIALVRKAESKISNEYITEYLIKELNNLKKQCSTPSS